MDNGIIETMKLQNSKVAYNDYIFIKQISAYYDFTGIIRVTVVNQCESILDILCAKAEVT